MHKKIVFFASFFILAFYYTAFFPQLAQAQAPVCTDVNTRCLDCDKCGYCYLKNDNDGEPNVPDDWADCAQCLYSLDTFQGSIPEIEDLDNSMAVNNYTIAITEQGFPDAQQGRFYTQLGCFSTSSDDYSFDAFQGGQGAANPTAALVRMLTTVTGGLAFLFLLYGAFLVITSQSKPARLQRGKLVIIGAVTGVTFSILGVFLVDFIAYRIIGLASGAEVYFEQKDDGNTYVVLEPNGKEYMGYLLSIEQDPDPNNQLPDTSSIEAVDITKSSILSSEISTDGNIIVIGTIEDSTNESQVEIIKIPGSLNLTWNPDETEFLGSINDPNNSVELKVTKD